jgi:predicted ester cyclase
MPPQENIDSLHRAWAQMKVKNLEGYLGMYSNSVIHHGFSSRIRPGVAGLRDHYTSLLKGFPDLRIEIEDVIAQGEKVSHRFAFFGTHRGAFLGIAPTGKPISVVGIQFNLFAGGKCTEVWSVHDTYRFLKQIGAVPQLRDRTEVKLSG